VVERPPICIASEDSNQKRAECQGEHCISVRSGTSLPKSLWCQKFLPPEAYEP
jgi:hypothetical protein